MLNPSTMVGCDQIVSRSTVNGSPAIIAIWAAAIISPACTDKIVQPRTRSVFASMITLIKPRVSLAVFARGTAAIGCFAIRTVNPCFRASVSDMPTRASSGSLNSVNGTNRR